LAMLSGFSYLAFLIWPTAEPTNKKKKHLPFSLETLLNWNNESNFKLITLIDWLELKQAKDNFTFADLVQDCENFKKRKIWSKKNASVQIDASEPQGVIFGRYKSIVRKLLDANVNAKNLSFIPITFFEVP